MGFPTTVGHPAYASGSASQFIPAVWSGVLVDKFYSATVFGEISNTKHESEIKNLGDTVHIRTIPTITINDYSAGQALTYERPVSTGVDLVINKGKWFGFEIDDVMAKQADLDWLQEWGKDASEQMAINIDTDILANIYADVASSNKGATAGAKSASFDLGTTAAPIGLNKTNIIDYIVDLSTVCGEANLPKDRFLVLPEWAGGMLLKSDLKNASITGDGQSILRNGRIGQIGNFTIYLSNNIATSVNGSMETVYHIIAGHKSGLTFASQMTKLQHIATPTETFAELVRGLNVYGYKVIKSDSLVLLEAKIG